MGRLGIHPGEHDHMATLEDAQWLADALAFDHDAPVGLQPAYRGTWANAMPLDPDGLPKMQPVRPLAEIESKSYWDNVGMAYGAAAEARFGDPIMLRYEDEPDAPRTDFSERFAGREELVSMYAMAARQADVLSEYLCLYRILEAGDGGNGKRFAASHLSAIPAADFGCLPVVYGIFDQHIVWTNAFALYRLRARVELLRLDHEGVTDVPGYLYAIPYSLAHGKADVLVSGHGHPFAKVARSLPIVKLLARLAVEP